MNISIHQPPPPPPNRIARHLEAHGSTWVGLLIVATLLFSKYC